MNTIKEESYQALFRRYYPRMFYYAKRIVGGGKMMLTMWFKKFFLNCGIVWILWISMNQL